ncbi:MAG TPA: PhnD/SsuA/transferrin family substrate-binding protein [Sporichthyaceae bacterium]|nr:PhnD/SsuA/transferrin family substrate-binding protein [Sporichthyaceae bacterium]
MTLVMGAVAYDAKVVPIWTGFRAWLRDQGVDYDYVLYSNYERQVDDLIAGHIHAAWNSPLAWLRARRLAEARGVGVVPAVMRDTDRDLTSVIVVRADAGYERLADLKGERVAVGAVDSPQATLIPLALLRGHGAAADGDVLRFDIGVGLHGDHIGGEREAARALVAGEAAAACMIDANHLLFATEGILPPGTRVLASTDPYDHCVMAVRSDADSAAATRFVETLLAMDYADPAVRPLMDLEGLTRWEPGRDTGFGQLDAAVDAAGFYDRAGAVTAAGYRP